MQAGLGGNSEATADISDVVGGDTLGLMHAVRELYGEMDSQVSYHFIHLTPHIIVL